MTTKNENISKTISVKNILFAVLFVINKVSVSEFSDKLGMSLTEIKYHLQELDSALSNTPLKLVYAEDYVRLVTRPDYAEYIRKFKQQRPYKLSIEALETLAVIIYKQPCTRQEIEHIRGVDCEKTLSTLLKAGLIKAVGNIKHPGSPLMYSITEECLFAFGVRSYKELHQIINKAREEEL